MEAYLRPSLLWILTLYIVLAFAGLPVLRVVVINISTNVLIYKRQFQLVTDLFSAFYDLLVQNAAKLRLTGEA